MLPANYLFTNYIIEKKKTTNKLNKLSFCNYKFISTGKEKPTSSDSWLVV